LIEDLLEVSRIINGKFRMRDESVELHRVLAAAVDTIRPLAADKKLTLECMGLDKTIYVRGDAQRLQQVAWNLLTNAVKFTPEGGKIRVGLDRVDANARLRVIDTGQGIAPEILPTIFNRFSQADTSATRAHGGLGLGMSIVKHIVGLHHGTVVAESDGAGKGATFTVLIPVQAIRPDSGVSQPGHSKPTHTALKGKRLLVVDDEESARAVLDATLRTFGAEVTLSSCVPDAIELLRTQPFDAVISDVAMPVQTGFDLVRLLRREKPGVDPLPVIALTAYASIDDQTAAIEAGFAMHVSKPVEPLELVSNLVGLLQSDHS
jgi:CheY-like chemotaxis protein